MNASHSRESRPALETPWHTLLVATLTLAAILPAVAPAQNLLEVWVDPVNGNDLTGMIGNPSLPYQTITNVALPQLCADLQLPQHQADEGIVHCLPGLYTDDPSGNGENFPIIICDRVHIIGFGAKECVIRGTVQSTTPFVYWPLCSGPGGLDKQVLVDFRGDDDPSTESSIQRLTFQGGDVQVYVEAELIDQAARISNCVFDMRDGGDQQLHGPSFGILIVNFYVGFPAFGYLETPCNIINNTFIQGWQKSPPAVPGSSCGAVFAGACPEVERAIADAVAICNVNNPVGLDPDLSARGVADLNIQNNLIRGHPAYPRTAFLGIDASDTAAAVGSQLGPTNCFDSTLSTNISLNYLFCSQTDITYGPPVAAVDLISVFFGSLIGVDPGFIGELLQVDAPALMQHRDWRLVPDSPVREVGTAPVALGPDQKIIAVSGAEYVETAAVPSSFLWDGEGLGNPRVTGAFPDCGFDETDTFMVTGCYGNDSKSYKNPWDVSIQPGQSDRILVFPAGGGAFLWATFRPYAALPAWTEMPGTIPVGVPVNLPPSVTGTLWLDPGSLINFTVAHVPAGPILVPPVALTNPIETFILQNGFPIAPTPHALGLAHVGTLPDIPVYFLNEQATFNTNPTLSTGWILSNLQSEHL